MDNFKPTNSISYETPARKSSINPQDMSHPLALKKQNGGAPAAPARRHKLWEHRGTALGGACFRWCPRTLQLGIYRLTVGLIW